MWHSLGLPISLGEAISVAVIGLSAAGLALYFGRRVFIQAGEPSLDGKSSASFQLAFADAGTERRTSPRRRGSSVAAHLTDDSDEDPVEVWVLDRSLGGLCLLSEAPVASGSVLRVRPRHASGGQLWTPVRVRSCHRDREGWRVHCQFLQVPPMNVLLLFG